MNLSKRLAAFVKLGEKLSEIDSTKLSSLTIPAKAANGWFTESEIKRAFFNNEDWILLSYNNEFIFNRNVFPDYLKRFNRSERIKRILK